MRTCILWPMNIPIDRSIDNTCKHWDNLLFSLSVMLLWANVTFINPVFLVITSMRGANPLSLSPL